MHEALGLYSVQARGQVEQLCGERCYGGKEAKALSRVGSGQPAERILTGFKARIVQYHLDSTMTLNPVSSPGRVRRVLHDPVTFRSLLPRAWLPCAHPSDAVERVLVSQPVQEASCSAPLEPLERPSEDQHHRQVLHHRAGL